MKPQDGKSDLVVYLSCSESSPLHADGANNSKHTAATLPAILFLQRHRDPLFYTAQLHAVLASNGTIAAAHAQPKQFKITKLEAHFHNQIHVT